MTEPALKIDPEYHPCRRVYRHDINEMGAFLCKRIKERWVHLQDRQILGWLITCAESNEYFFVRTDRAFLLAQSNRDFLEQYPWVKEVFCFAYYDDVKFDGDGKEAEAYRKEIKESAVFQAASLYEDLIRWAQKICANEIIVDRFTDVPVKDDKDPKNMGTIKGRMGRLFKSEEVFARLDPDKIRKV